MCERAVWGGGGEREGSFEECGGGVGRGDVALA